jgi:hypothetical protein
MAIGAVIAIVFGGLVYSASVDLNDVTSSHINHALIPPFRG